MGVLAAGLLLPAHPSFAVSGCPSGLPPAQMTMSVDSGSVAIDNGRSHAEIKRIKRRTGAAAPSGQWDLLGLTVTGFKFTMRVSVRLYPLPDGRYCATPQSVTSSIGYPEFTIYIGRKHTFGTCQHRVIRAHEEAHVALYRRNLQRYAPLLRRRLEIAVRQFQPLIAPSKNEGTERVKNLLNLKIDPLIKEMQRNVDAENALIDTRESYRTIRRSCRNW